MTRGARRTGGGGHRALVGAGWVAIASSALAACPGQPDAVPRVDAGNHSPPDGGPAADASEGNDADLPGLDADVPEPLPTGCTAARGRGLCRLETLADWEAAEHVGTAAGDEGVALTGEGLTEGYDDGGDLNGGTFFEGSVTSAVLEPGMAFDGAVASWNVATPAGTWIAIAATARVGGTWTSWYRLGVWASSRADLTRHSYDGEEDGFGRVLTDTIVLGSSADAIRLRATLYSADGVASPTLRRLAVALSDSSAGRPPDDGGRAWGAILDVPARSQMVFVDGGEVWCSPTSTSMIIAYWGRTEGRADWDLPVPTVVEGTWDEVYGGYGNWPFNVAYAASVGLEGVVAWLASVADLEPWIAAGVPAVISAQWEPGDLDNAPISSTDGHLLVVRGFEANGDVAVNDPAAAGDAEVSRVYDRAQLEAVWQGGSGGIAYLIFPPGRAVPW